MKNNTEFKDIQKKFNELVKQPLHSFRAKDTRDIPIKKGVYVIRDKNNEVLHVGQTPRAKNGIKQRIENHLQGRSSFVYHYFKGNGNKLKKQDCYFQFLIIDDNPRKRALVESYTIGCLCPKHIGLGKKTF